MKKETLPTREYEPSVNTGLPEESPDVVSQFIHKQKTRKRKKEIGLSPAGAALLAITETPTENKTEVVIAAENKLNSLLEVKKHDEEMIAAAPDDQSLEAGMATLAGELLQDGRDMLAHDRVNPPLDPEILVKRRTYVTNVLNHVGRVVNSRAAIRIKKSEEKRNNTDFLMKLLAKSQAGTITDAELAILESSYAEQAPVKPVVAVEVTAEKK